jgi:hypothetical protein
MSDQEKQPTQEQMDSLTFMSLVDLYQHSAWMAMGKIADPITSETKRNLPQARWAIDTLQMLERKTRGNLDENELRFLRDMLHTLRMNYVEEVNKPADEPAKEDSSQVEEPKDEAQATESTDSE